MMLALRRWHRWVSTVIGVFLLVMAATGALLQSQFLVHGFPPAGASPGGEAVPESAAGPPLDHISAKVGMALAIAARRYPRAGIDALTLTRRGTAAIAELRINGLAAPAAFDLATGRELPASAPAPPPAGPLDQRIHQLAFDIHTGQLFHLPGEVMTLLCGLSLLFLAVSGLWLLARMYLQRSRSGRKGLFWSS
jgi:uncharacterized iron-regulated membrane protein